jgi:hypothetical protein
MSMRVHIALKGITDLELLLEALREMGITGERLVSASAAREPGRLLVRAFWGRYPVGFVKDKKGEIRAVGDNESPLMRSESLQKKIRQHYSLAAVKRKVVEMRYHVAEVEAMEDGSIRLVARQWR